MTTQNDVRGKTNDELSASAALARQNIEALKQQAPVLAAKKKHKRPGAGARARNYSRRVVGAYGAPFAVSLLDLSTSAGSNPQVAGMASGSP